MMTKKVDHDGNEVRNSTSVFLDPTRKQSILMLPIIHSTLLSVSATRCHWKTWEFAGSSREATYRGTSKMRHDLTISCHIISHEVVNNA